jgi:hypothetical protein
MKISDDTKNLISLKINELSQKEWVQSEYESLGKKSLSDILLSEQEFSLSVILSSPLFWYNYNSVPSSYTFTPNISIFYTDLEGLKITDKKFLISFISNEPIGGSMDVQNYPNLENLQCNGIGLTSLNLQNLPSLKELRFGGNNTLEVLNLQEAPNLERMFFGGLISNSIKTIDFSSFKKLQEISSAPNANLTALDVFDLPDLTNLDVRGTNISTTHLTNLPKLSSLNIGSSQTSYLDFSGLSASPLHFLAFNTSTRLTEVHFPPTLPTLATLNCINCNLTGINLEGFTNLEVFNGSNSVNNVGYNNVFETLDFSFTNKLKTLRVERNFIKDLTLGYQPDLTTIIVSNNSLSSLELSGVNSSVNVLNAEANNLSSLDVSTIPLVTNLNLRFNNIQGNLIGLNSLSAFSGNKNVRLQNNDMTTEHLNSYLEDLPVKEQDMTGNWTVFIRNNPGTTTVTLSTGTSKGWVVNTTSN